jgi:hypothetical protein
VRSVGGMGRAGRCQRPTRAKDGASTPEQGHRHGAGGARAGDGEDDAGLGSTGVRPVTGRMTQGRARQGQAGDGEDGGGLGAGRARWRDRLHFY